MIVKKELIPRNKRDYSQGVAIHLAKDLIKLLTTEGELSSDLIAGIIKKMVLRRRALEESNGRGIFRLVQLYAILIKEGAEAASYPYFDIEPSERDIGTVQFLEETVQEFLPDTYQEYKGKNEELRMLLLEGKRGIYKGRSRR